MNENKWNYNMQEFICNDSDNITYICFLLLQISQKEKSSLNRVRIEVSDNIDKLIEKLNIESPFFIRLWYKFPVKINKVEYLKKALDNKFKHSKINEKWFNTCSIIPDFIKLHKDLSGIKEEILKRPRHKTRKRNWIKLSRKINPNIVVSP